MSNYTNSSSGNEPDVTPQFKKHPILKFIFVLITISLLVVFISFLKISQISNSREIYGLGDAMSFSCSQLGSLDEFFGLDNDRSDCVDNPERLARDKESAREPLYKGMLAVSSVAFFISIILLTYFRKKPAPSKEPGENKNKDSEKQYLVKLRELKDSGLLSPEEYESKRNKFLDSL
jgi:hypothetical protein